MKRLSTIAFSLLLGTNAAFGSEAPDWTYEGHFGPHNWAHVDPDYAACSEGQQQSPVNLEGGFDTELYPVEIHWNTTTWTVINNGYTIEISADDAGYAMIDEVEYTLKYFQIRNPSEHAIRGQHYPMEIQFVHEDKRGHTAIISVMVKGGGQNYDFEEMMAQAPTRKLVKNFWKKQTPEILLTDIGDIYRYEGSFTTPPCAETVMWTVLTDPLVVSDTALFGFNALFKMNARPLQPLHRRYLLTD